MLSGLLTRHPMYEYIQGMNDLISPIIAIFLCEKFGMDIFQLENNSQEIECLLQSQDLIEIEADAFFVFSSLIEKTDRKLQKNFVGINSLMYIFEDLIELCSPKIFGDFKAKGIEMIHFAFRWMFCLLLREFPFFLSMKLLTYYFISQENPQEICLYFALVLLLMYQKNILSSDRDKTIIFLQRLPTELWGFEDISMLYSEATSLKNITREIMIEKSFKYREYFS